MTGPRSIDEFLLAESDELAWETYHENSKTSRHAPHVYYNHHPSDAEVVATMQRLREVKPYLDRPHRQLPAGTDPALGRFRDTLADRASARGFGAGGLALSDLADVLRCAYGPTRDERDRGFPRRFRTSPSGGALYPLELYVWAREVTGLPPGLYHLDPLDDELDELPDPVDDPAAAFVQSDLVASAAAVLLLSAVFFRSTFKYGDRGYRFVLLEAGHVAQNVMLAAQAAELATVPIGGYFDRELDRTLGLNGVDESVVYTVALGPPAPAPEPG